MSGFFSFGSASAPANPQDGTYEPLGYNADGSLTLVTGGATNTKGSYAAIGVTANAWCGFWLDVGVGSSSTNRYLLDISLDGGSTIAVQDLYIAPGTTLNHRIYIPLQVPPGRTISCRVQSSAGAGTVRFAILGRISTANTPPGFTTSTRLVAADTANTRPPATSVGLQSSLATWTQLLAATVSDYGALLVSFGDNATPASVQQGMSVLGIGAAGSEVEFARFSTEFQTTGGNIARMNLLIQKLLRSGSRIAAAAIAPTPGTDAIRVGLIGFS